MTHEMIQKQLARVGSIVVLLSDAPPDEVRRKLPEVIQHLQEIQSENERNVELKLGEMRIA